MSLRGYLITMICATLLAWASWVWVLFFIDPEQAGSFGIFLFYATLFLSFFGTFSLIGFFLRFLVRRHTLAWSHVSIAFRQAASYAAIVIGLLFLRSQGLLTWWNTLLFIGALTVLEFFFLSLRKQPRNRES